MLNTNYRPRGCNTCKSADKQSFIYHLKYQHKSDPCQICGLSTSRAISLEKCLSDETEQRKALESEVVRLRQRIAELEVGSIGNLQLHYSLAQSSSNVSRIVEELQEADPKLPTWPPSHFDYDCKLYQHDVYGPSTYNSSSTSEEIPPPLHLQEDTRMKVGFWRGIQAENNSCYIDSSLFALFATHDLFIEYLAFRPGHKVIQNQVVSLLRRIVHSLRVRAFCAKHLVVELREMLGLWESNSHQRHCEEQDVAEFVPRLFDFLRDEDQKRAQRHIPDVVTCFLFYPPQIDSGTRMTVQTLLSLSMKELGICYAQAPKTLLIHIPRETSKSLGMIVPNGEIDLSQFIETANSPLYELRAVICIGISHYVTFVKSGLGWFYFDSMAGQTSSYFSPRENIPRILEAPGVTEILADPAARMVPSSYRMAKDMYMCVYGQKGLCGTGKEEDLSKEGKMDASIGLDSKE